MATRIRAALATVTSAPWRRAPVLLLGRPGVLVTVASACTVMVASLASVPLFLSSVGSASVALQAEERCPRDTGASLALRPTPDEVRTPSPDPFRPVAADLGPSNRWVEVEEATLAAPGGGPGTPVSLLARDRAVEHIEVLDGADGPGLWITDRAAELTGLGVGDTAAIGTATAPVVGVYRDLSGSTVDDFWCSNASLVLLEVRGADLVRPPPMVLADPGTLATLMGGLGLETARGVWEAPLRDSVTVSDAEVLVATLACRGPRGAALVWCEDGQPSIPGMTSPRGTSEPTRARDDADFVERFLGSSLPFVIDRSEATRTSVAGGVWPMAGFAALAGAGLVAASASLWLDRRRREVTLLTVRGVSPAGLGAKAVLELLGPLVVGGLAGVALAYGLVVRLGPSSLLEPASLAGAARAGALALLGAAAIVATVVAWRTTAHGSRRHRRFHLASLPWEALLAVATVVSYRRLGDWGVPIGRGAEVSRVDVWGLLFPLLFLVTVVAVLSRVLALTVRPVLAVSRAWPTAPHLGVRRVARYRVAVIGLVAASALSAGVLGYAASMNRSLDATLAAKATTFVGSDVAVRLAADEVLPPALADRATQVRAYGRAWIDDGRRQNVSVLAIDPSTFAEAAFWDPSFADASLDDVVARLAAPPTDGSLPAVVVGTEVAGPVEVGIVLQGTKRFTVDAVPGVRAFPGMRRPEPTVFVAASAIADLELDGGRAEAWISGDRPATLAALTAAGIGYEEERRAAEVADGAAFLTVSWTFGFMQSLGISAGLLALGGVAVYLDARRRERLLGYAFMRRMGLSRGQHRWALVLELTAGLVVGCWTGLAIAVAGVWLAHGRIDPVPGFRPEPLLRVAGPLIVVLAVGALVVTVVAAVLAQRRVDRDDPVEVLRAGA
jgi:putative ABC transport system permease protein